MTAPGNGVPRQGADGGETARGTAVRASGSAGGRAMRARCHGALIAGLMALMLLSIPGQARAGFTVDSPIVHSQETEVELHVSSQWNGSRTGSREDEYVVAAGHGFTDIWFSEIELEFEREPGGKVVHEATSWENTFQLTPQGKYWLDAGLLLSYEAAGEKEHPDKIEVKGLFQKQWGKLEHTLNLTLEREVGVNADDKTEPAYAWQSRWLLSQRFEPGFEVFGSEDDLRAGPMFRGAVRVRQRSVLVYELGYLHGLTTKTPQHTLKGTLELEF